MLRQIIKLINEERPMILPYVINKINKVGKIQKEWKMKRMVLLRKLGKDPLLPTSYSPITILPTLSEVWENTFKILMEKKLDQDLFYTNQYGFRRKRSTIDAVL